MSTQLDDRGRRFVVCSNCGTEGPHVVGNREARQAAKDAGFSRVYKGSGEDFLCSGCRIRRSPTGGGYKYARHLRSDTNPKFSMCGRHHVDLTDDPDEVRCGHCERYLDRVAKSPSDQEDFHE